MSSTENQPKKKSKKKKKASSMPVETLSNAAPDVPIKEEVKDKILDEVVLPKTINDKTYFKEIEVTMAQNIAEATQSPSSGSKSKKKSAAAKKTNDKKKPNTNPDVSTEPPLLFSFSRNIDVSENSASLSTNSPDDIPSTGKQTDVKKSKSNTDIKTPSLPQESAKAAEISLVASLPGISLSVTNSEASQQNTNVPQGSTNSSKKRKKKKKAQNAADDTNKDGTGEKTNATPNSGTQNSISATPQCVKLPSTGNSKNSILIVGGGSFPGDSSLAKQDTMSFGNHKESKVIIADLGIGKTSAETSLQQFALCGGKPSVSIVPCANETPQPKVVIETTASNVQPLNKQENKGKKAKPNKKESNPQESKPKPSQESNKNSEKKQQPTAEKPKPLKAKATFTTKFQHLQKYRSLDTLTFHLKSNHDAHPAVLAFAIQCAEGIIEGSDARCVAFLAALKEVIADYETPPNKELCRDLEAKLDSCACCVSKCRPLSVSMQNAIKFLKFHVTNMPAGMTDVVAKENLTCQIEKFVNEEICLAQLAISSYAAAKIVDGDTILTFAFSSVVLKVLMKALEEKKTFKVIIVDSRPKFEGKRLLEHLLKHGVECSYVLISAVSYVMKDATKVFIGAHSLHANGYVMSRIGCSQIALVASWYNVPFLVCCETYKFCERVHTDSLSYNELGNNECFVKPGVIEDSLKEIPQLQMLNLLYDITPPHLVSMVITEKGMLPCTSVPVVLRVRHAGAVEDQLLSSSSTK